MSADYLAQWIALLKQGDPQAAAALWRHCYDRLVIYARHRFGSASRREADEEDAALSAFGSLCRGAAAGRYPHLDDPDDLWRLLFTLTARKVCAQQTRERAAKRGGGEVGGESRFDRGGTSAAGIAGAPGLELPPDLEVMALDSCEQLLAALGDDTLRRVAQLKLEGYTTDEIAQQIQCKPRTVERKLNRIRVLWSETVETSPLRA
jgi:DNA-directed RNA polymerase specialized sigma24 family protein